MQGAPAKPPRKPDRPTVWAGLAVGLLLFWQQLAFRAVAPTAPELAVPLLGNVRSDVGWIAFVVALTLSAGASWSLSRARRRRVERKAPTPPGGRAASQGRRGRLVAGCACMAAGTALTLWVPGMAWAVLLGGALAGLGFMWAARLVFLALGDAFPSGTVVDALMLAVGVQLVCGLLLMPLPESASLVALCLAPILFGCCMARLQISATGGSNPTAYIGGGATEAQEVGAAIARHEAQRALVVCLVALFFAILYTNITGFRFNAFPNDELLRFNLDITVAKSALLVPTLALVRRRPLSSVPLAIMTLFTTSMLVAAFAPDAQPALLAADSLAAAGRWLSFAYAFLAFDTMRRAEWPNAGAADSLVVCLSGAAVLLSVLTGSLIQSYIELSVGGFALATAAVLYVLLIASNLLLRQDEARPVVVQLEGSGADEEALATRRAQALAARFPELTARETQIVGLALLGLTAPSVAGRLSISENTAKTHMRRIYQKLGVHSRQELLELAYQTAPARSEGDRAGR